MKKRVYCMVVSHGDESFAYTSFTEDGVYEEVITDMQIDLYEIDIPDQGDQSLRDYARHLVAVRGGDITFENYSLLEESDEEPSEDQVSITKRFFDELIWEVGCQRAAIYSKDPDRRAYGREHVNNWHKRLPSLMISLPEGNHPSSEGFTKREWTSIETYAWMALANKFGADVIASEVMNYAMKMKDDRVYWNSITVKNIPDSAKEIYDYWWRLFQLQLVPQPGSATRYVKVPPTFMPEVHYLGILDSIDESQ